MSYVPIFAGRCKDGKVIFARPLDWAKHVKAHEGLAVEVTLKKPRSQRSLKQNRAYFGIIVQAVAEHCGYSKDEAHEALAFKFLRVGEPDALLPTRRSTTSLSTQEFEAYSAQCKQFAAEELGIYVPDPSEIDL